MTTETEESTQTGLSDDDLVRLCLGGDEWPVCLLGGQDKDQWILRIKRTLNDKSSPAK